MAVAVAAHAMAGPAAPLDARATLAARYGGDAAWYAQNIPLFASSDPALDDTWYYRWALYRAHQRDLGSYGYISTEFFDDVGWQRQPWAGLNDASAFHIAEGRWLRHRRFAGDYIDYLYAHGGNDRHFSESIADAVWGRYLADGDRASVVRHLPTMQRIDRAWDDHFDPARGLYWIEPLLDATEYSVASIEASGGKDGFRGGDAFRPSINSYMVANARAISRIATLAGDWGSARLYAAKADTLRTHMLVALWSPQQAHFVDRYHGGNAFVQDWAQIGARELAGYLPWAYGVVGQDRRYDAAWSHLLDARQLAGPYGLRTVEPAFAYYMRQYRYDGDTGLPECQWNGPIWPFQTTQALMALARLLHDRGADAPASKGDYLRLLRQYAALHRQGNRFDLEEDYAPDTGKPIVGLARSHHYFHSAFNDLVVTGLVGVIPAAGRRLVIDPLMPGGQAGLAWFALQDLPYHGHRLTVTYDRDGRHFARGQGLRVYLDGHLATQRQSLGRLIVTIVPRANPVEPRPIDLAVQLLRGGWPHIDASSGRDPERLHQAADGRISFFRELPNGWLSDSGAAQEWVDVTFRQAIRPRRVELVFGQDEGAAVPDVVTILSRARGRWRPVGRVMPDQSGMASVAIAQGGGDALRLTFDKAPQTRVKLVEFKVF